MKTKITLLSLALSLTTLGQTAKEKNKITKEYNFKKLDEFHQKIQLREKNEKENIRKYALKNHIPQRTIDSSGKVFELQRIYNGKPIYFETNNEAAAISTRARFLNSGGNLGLNLDGQNMNIGVWDAGYAKLTHQEYDGIGGQNRVQNMDVNSEYISGRTMESSHAAHVIGTIAASGVNPLAKGMAPQAKVKSYIWNNVLSEATTEARNGLLISSHSYGDAAYDGAGNYIVEDYYAGAYIDLSRDWDNLMYNTPSYLMITATGNNGTRNTSRRPLQNGFDKILGYKTCKNALVVANAQDAQIDANGNLINVEIHPSSSQGPTDDLRIKPDITGNGTEVFSTNHDGDANYSTKTGSSMATPNVSGTSLLLQQHYNNLNNRYMKAATLKGLILHTADDAGMVGPDAIFGWGLMNAKKAAEVITNRNKTSKIQELSLNNGQTYEFQVESDGLTPLIASISWTDPASYNLSTIVNDNTAKLINDLDIRISKDGVNYLPWKLTGATTNELGDNTRDPYERIAIQNATGIYTIRISHKKSSLSGGLQNYSLIISGLKEQLPCVTTLPTGIQINKITNNSANIIWNTSANNNYEVSYKKTSSSIWTILNTSTNSINLTGLVSSTNYELRIRNTCDFSDFSNYSTLFNFKTPITNDLTAPTAPTNLAAANTTTNATQLNWTASTDNVAIKNYEVYQNGNLIGTTTTTSFAVINLLENTNYTFTVRAVDTNANYSTYSNSLIVKTLSSVVVDTIAPTAPTNLAAANTTTNATQLNWTSSTDNVAIKNYEVYQNGDLIGTTTATSFAVINLLENTNYTFTVRAVDTNANYSTYSNSLIVKTLSSVVVDTIAPTAPTNLAAANTTTNATQLNWTASTDNVAIKNYEVYQNGNLIGTTTATSFAVINLLENTNYTFTVRAVDTNANYSVISNSITIKTLTNIIISNNYCKSTANYSTTEWIDYVELNQIKNQTISGNGYNDFTKIQTNIPVGNNTITLSVGTKYLSSYTKYNFVVWIDFNKNGQFETSEKIVNTSSYSTTNFNTNFVVPATASLGNTRMRIQMKTTSPTTTACDNFNYGEVEDYTVNITNNIVNVVEANEDVSSEEIKLNFYPNPVTDELYLSEEVNFLLYNELGILIKEGINNKKIDMTKYTNGVYYLKIIDKNTTFKIIKI